MRLIDAHKLWDVMNKATLHHIVTNTLWNTMKSVIENAPTIDAVEVVRCKDCKYKRLYDEDDTKYYYCALEDRPNRNWSVDDTDYCSWGEKGEVEK